MKLGQGLLTTATVWLGTQQNITGPNKRWKRMEKEGLLGCIMSQIIRTRKTKGQTTFMPKSASQLKIIHKGSINASQAS
jgi:hypothetical protein